MANDWNLKGRTPVEYRRVKNFIQELQPLILADSQPLDARFALSDRPVALAESLALERRPVAEGEVWGRTWQSGYFRLEGTVPGAWAGHPVAAWLDFGGEALVYGRDGEPLWGLAHGSAFDEHYSKDVYQLLPRAVGGERVEIFVEAAANNLFGVREAPAPAQKDDPARHGTWEARIRRMRIARFDPEVWHLSLDLKVLLELWEHLDQETPRAARILGALVAATHTFQGDPGRAGASRALLARELEVPAQASSLSTTVVGHAHIDTAWLWALGETRRKTARTYASQLDLIGRYPGYVFGASAPQHHQWMKESYPGLFARIRRAVADGTWEPQGGMWIEADCNLPSGESLVRQFLHGKNFWKDEFGVDVRNCWIPDVFGYAGSLPQIMRKSGVDFFLTQKLSWSKFNNFPHDTFRWRGIDGTEVVTHFPPEYTYNSAGTPGGLRTAEKTFHEKAFVDEFITLLGIGDGGGGPKEEHLEHILRARNTEGLPRASFGRADDLFRRLSLHRDDLDVWVGELYLEYHRGTYTTQASTKRNNRRLEARIRAVEGLWAALPLGDYPQEALDTVMKTLLLHQFHDIIPGSSIHQVYVEAEAAYTRAFDALEALAQEAGRRLLTPSPGAWTLYNVLPYAWEGLVVLPPSFGDRGACDLSGRPVATQREDSSTLAWVTVPAQGFLTLVPGVAPAAPRPSDPLVLENDQIRYRFNLDGQLVEAWDKEAQRSVLRAGGVGNVLAYYEDTPHNFDAWDIDFYYQDQLLETARGVSVLALGSGAVGTATRFVLTVGHSRIVQTVRLGATGRQLTFETEVEWAESRRLLRTSFPLDSLATEATCEVAYGHVRRPTHQNTEWDFAKFEVCAHRWVDIGDARYGTALINDGKYGHSVVDNVLGLSLLRSPLYPDPDADQGTHRFTYALVPRRGSLEASDVVERAAALNQHPLGFADLAGQPDVPLRVSGTGFSLEAVKKAEKEEAWVVRVVENRGLGAEGTLAPFPGTVCETDLVEWNDGPPADLGAGHRFTLLPFEIKTFKIRHAPR